ncbi:DNA alkylation repair protein [Peribacillus tepidiphilus]|uniref:DNA alkylation repair protein n=1 Tax=Peribacillus tepidiphilus TaxID=2652445 RepID=UPI0035B4FAE7
MEKSQILYAFYKEHANPENAEPMSKYMKNHFIFFGIRAPERKALTRQFFNETGILKQSFDRDFVKELWYYPERELQYAAIDYGMKFVKKLEPQDIELLQFMIINKSWWDTVDLIASYLVGGIAAKYEFLKDEYLDKWATDENMWLRRTAILFQLKYKDKTDENRLYTNIEKNADSKEFFIQKAIGWALREYSKTNPDSVRRFIETHQLAKLSVKEGSKYI